MVILSAQTKQGSPSQSAPTARPPAPSLSHPLDSAWGRRGRRRMVSCSQHGSSGCRPVPPGAPLLPQSPPAVGGALRPRVPPPPRSPRNRAPSSPARRSPHPERSEHDERNASRPLRPHSPVPSPPESGRASAAPTRCPRPRSPASPPDRTTAAARGARVRTICREGRGPARAPPGRNSPSLRRLHRGLGRL